MVERTPPWLPKVPVDVSPVDYERQVIEWLRNAGAAFAQFKIEHLEKRSGKSGDYTFDGIVEFEIFDGAKIVVLIECKRLSRPVEREVLLTFPAKLAEVGAHKAMVFSTSGFQKGALDFASNNGIATVVFVDAIATYMTRSRDQVENVERPPWLPEYAGLLVTPTDRHTSMKTIDKTHVSPIVDWVNVN